MPVSRLTAGGATVVTAWFRRGTASLTPHPELPVSDAAALLDLLAPVLARLAGEDVEDPTLAARLNADLPVGGDAMRAVRSAICGGLEAGWLTPRAAGGVRFGRLAKANDASRGFSIDAVDMSGPGPGHTHPGGEIDLCFDLEGTPTFDGSPPGWTVYGAGSWHVPTVEGGRMAILYFLPGGKIRFEPKPA